MRLKQVAVSIVLLSLVCVCGPPLDGKSLIPPNIEVHKVVYHADGKVVERADVLGRPYRAVTWCHFKERDGTSKMVVACEQWYDDGGKPGRNHRGVHAHMHKRDRPDGKVSVKWFANEHGGPMEDSNGIAAIEYHYGSRGSLKATSFLDGRRGKATDADGVHRVAYENRRGICVGWAYFGPAGQKRASSDSVHRMSYDDKRGCQVYYGVDGREIVKKTEEEKDEKTGNIIVKHLDRNRNVIERRFYDQNRELIVNTSGWHRQVSTYNKANLWTSRSYYCLDGSPWADSRGIHRHNRRFDDVTGWRALEKSCVGVRNQPVDDERGIHKTSFTYDKAWRETSKSFFDRMGKPVGDGHGVHRYETAYYPRGRTKYKATFGADGQPTKGKDGWVRADYTKRGKRTVTYPKKKPEDVTYPVDVHSYRGNDSISVNVHWLNASGAIVHKSLAGDCNVKKGKQWVPHRHRTWVRAGTYTVKAIRDNEKQPGEREQRLVVTPGPGVRGTVRFDWAKKSTSDSLEEARRRMRERLQKRLER